jgi:chromosome segregation ATPase
MKRFAGWAILCAVFLLTNVAKADDIAAAKQAVAAAQNRLLLADTQVQNLKLALARAENQLRNAQSRVDLASVNVQNVQTTLSDTRDLDQAGSDLQSASQAVEDKSAQVRAVQVELDAATAKVDEARIAARKKFEATDAYVKSDDAIHVAQKHLDDATAASTTRMEKDSGYAPLAHDAEAAQHAVEDLRAKNDPGVNDASSQWMAAKNRVGQFTQKWLDADESVAAAKAELSSAQQAQRKLLVKFDDDLASDPQYADAAAQRESQRKTFAELNSQLLQLTAAQETARSRQKTLQQRHDNAQQQLAAAQIEVQNSQVNADQLAQQVRDLREKLRAAMAAQTSAQHDCDAAAERLRKAIAEQNHPPASKPS